MSNTDSFSNRYLLRHCEERSDEAIQFHQHARSKWKNWIASAITWPRNDGVLLLVFFFLLSASPLFAAPFCTKTQELPAECIYNDPVQCRARAAQLSGFCVANPAELVIRSGETGSYCLVLGSRNAECIYADRTSCENDAISANGVCIEYSTFNVSQNPYLLDINRKY